MDDRRQRILEDLTGVVRGEVRTDAIAAATYASDASLYQVPPLAVAFPKDRDDVVAIARYAESAGLPVVARGAGTGIAGQAIGRGIVVDFSRHMRRIVSIGTDSVVVEPGVVHDRLNRVLREHGLYFPPDPSNTRVTTVGGMLGVDAAGSRAVHVGSTRDHAREIEVVLAGGTVLDLGNEPLSLLHEAPPAASAADDPEEVDPAQLRRTLVSKLSQMLRENDQTIREWQPPLLRNASGYMLRGVLDESSLNLPRLLVGSEGTLGLFTRATLHTLPLPPHRAVALLLFDRLESATLAVERVVDFEPTACDLLDRRLLTLARQADDRFERLISRGAEAALLVELTGGTEAQLRTRMRRLPSVLADAGRHAVIAAEAYTPRHVDFLWSLPATVVPMLTRITGEARPVPIVEDVAVPPGRLHDVLVEAQRVFQRHEVTATLYAHAASGQLHMRPFVPTPTPQDGTRLESLARDLYEVVRAFGGTISGEHGDGLSRTAFVAEQYGPLYRLFQQVKDLFDPHNLMNPGKIVGNDPHLTIKNIRPGATDDHDLVELQMTWSPRELSEESVRCNGCGVCRSQVEGGRMCPFFRARPREENAPRSKANVMRNYAAGLLDPRQLTTDEALQLANTCFNCKQCVLECPSNVDVPHLAIEAKAAHVAANGLNTTDWVLSRSHVVGRFGMLASLLTNTVLASEWGRWLLERTVGIARQRRLPRFARRSFLRSVDRRLLRTPPRGTDPKPVVYFVDYFANYHDPDVARAFVAILHHHAIPVHVPRRQTASGMAMVGCGDLDAARRLAERNVRVLLEFAREGHDIVCTEPAAAVCLTQEYPMMLDHPDVQVVADRVVDAGTYLARLKDEGRLKTDFDSLPVQAAYHTPCHLKALHSRTPFEELVSLIPEASVRKIEKGCSGMAGPYGLAKRNLRSSLRMGWDLVTAMRDDRLDLGLTECSSCKMQMEQGTNTPTVHPLKILAHAYGLLPSVEKNLRPNHEPLVCS